MAKEAYSHGKRGLFTWQKRPIRISVYTPAATQAKGPISVSAYLLNLYVIYKI
jgi:hypothetical protein